MQIGHKLQFQCQACQHPIAFSVLGPDECGQEVRCESCEQKYLFDDQTLQRHLRKFEALCRQIYESEEILGSTSIAIDVGSHHVKVPFNILLTRLSSVIELSINGKRSEITFRLEPLKDVPEALALTHC